MIPEELILIADERVLAMPIQECGEPLVDVRTHGLQINVKDPDVPEGSEESVWLRRSVVERLVTAQAELPVGNVFLIKEGLRPLGNQTRIFQAYQQKLKQEHPQWDENTLYHEASRYIAPPDIVPPHTTGGAVDLTVVDADGNEWDMGTKVNAQPHLCENRSYTLAKNISDLAKSNREMMAKVLGKSAFVNYPTEWWHWSYGDRYWAYQRRESFAIYQSVHR